MEPWLRAAGLLVSQGFLPAVRGRRHVPRESGLLVFATHGGGPDFSYLVAAVPRPLRAVALRKTLRQPVVGWMLRMRGVYAIDASGVGPDPGTLEALHRAASDARAGAAIGLFPQGAGSRVQGGAVWVAAHAGVPVLPVFTYRIWARDGNRRALVRICRPVPPPGRRAAARRAFRDGFQRRMERVGASRGDRDTRALMDVALDDRELWRDPRRVVRMSARIHRLPPPARRRLGRRARLVTRATRRLRCSPDALRHPPGAREIAGVLLWGPAALAGLALCAPPLLVAALVARRARGRRAVGRHILGTALALPWGVVLAAAGLAAFGWPGLALAPMAAIGMLANGLLKRSLRPLLAWPRLARHGRRIVPHLLAVDRALRDGGRGAPARPVVADPSGFARAVVNRPG